MSAHTPGPWLRGSSGEGYLVGVPRTDSSPRWETATLNHYKFEKLIAIVHNVPPGIDGLANARLIASAPELLDALDALLAQVDSVANRTGWPDNAPRKAARAALVKARGE